MLKLPAGFGESHRASSRRQTLATQVLNLTLVGTCEMTGISWTSRRFPKSSSRGGTTNVMPPSGFMEIVWPGQELHKFHYLAFEEHAAARTTSRCAPRSSQATRSWDIQEVDVVVDSEHKISTHGPRGSRQRSTATNDED